MLARQHDIVIKDEGAGFNIEMAFGHDQVYRIPSYILGENGARE
jgi:hypothetical protein